MSPDADGVRNDWTRQWAMIDAPVEPTGFSTGTDGTIIATFARSCDLKGNVLFDKVDRLHLSHRTRANQELRYPPLAAHRCE
jgi:hypothetical protein